MSLFQITFIYVYSVNIIYKTELMFYSFWPDSSDQENIVTRNWNQGLFASRVLYAFKKYVGLKHLQVVLDGEGTSIFYIFLATKP